MKTFLYRFASSIFLLSVFAAAIFVKGPAGFAFFGVAATVLSFLAVREFCEMLGKAGKESFPMLAAFTSASMVAAFLIGYLPLALAVVLFACAQGWLILLFAKGRMEVLERTLNTLAVTAFLTVPFCILVTIYMLPGVGRGLLLFMILVTKIGDIGAYLVGTLSNKLMKGGNHKMVPSISPGKSWEGFAGGMAASIGLSLLLGPKAGACNSLLVATALGLVLFLGGFVGDLAESALKRICGVKDSGSSLPGIGGALDLLDSLMMNAPVFALYLVLSFMYG